MDDLSGLRVLVVDDYAQWRAVVAAQLLKGKAQLVGTAVDGHEAIQQARSVRPDVIVMDVSMPGLSGLAATREICQLGSESKILIVSNDTDPAIVAEAFAVGALGYVLKSRVDAELLKAIAAIVRGELFVGSGLAPIAADDTRERS
jgi:DNA-binding NarL/FixJ family response regulator